VSGLTKDDFIVTEGGRRQTISHFAVEDLRTLRPAAEPLPPDIFTNRYELKGGVPSAVTIILFDMLNTRTLDKSYARQQAVKFIRSELHPTDRVALYLLGAELTLAHDFTSDASGLLRALDRSATERTPELDSFDPGSAPSKTADLSAAFLKMENRLAMGHNISRVIQTTAALEGIANRVAGLPGRKSLVWITGGIPFSIGMSTQMSPDEKRRGVNLTFQFDREVGRAARALQAANVAIYPVDATGLSAGSNYQAKGIPSTRFDAMRGGAIGSAMPEEYYSQRESMTVLAARTGGRPYFDSNDLRSAIRQAVSDGKMSYAISYSPDHGKWDGHFQELKVQATRPGLSVRCRSGYFAWAERPASKEERRAAFLQLVQNPVEATGIRIDIAAKPDIPNKGNLSLRTRIEPADLSLRQDNGRWLGAVDIGYVHRDPGSGQTAMVEDTISFDMTHAEHDLALQQGVIAQKALKLPPGATEVQVVVRDATSGAAGSVVVALRSANGA